MVSVTRVYTALHSPQIGFSLDVVTVIHCNQYQFKTCDSDDDADLFEKFENSERGEVLDVAGLKWRISEVLLNDCNHDCFLIEIIIILGKVTLNKKNTEYYIVMTV